MTTWEEELATPTRGLIVDSHADSAARMMGILRRAFAGIVAHRAESAEQARLMFISTRPDVVVIATPLADRASISDMAQRAPRTCVLVSAGHIGDERIFPALRAGACGYLLKHEEGDALAGELRAIVQGARPLSPGLARQFLCHFTAIGPREPLDADEYRVLEGIAAGATVHALTSRLNIAVGERIRRIYQKLVRAERVPGPAWTGHSRDPGTVA